MANTEIKDDWISIDERLPEERLGVLIYCPAFKNIYLAYLEKGQWHVFGASSQMIIEPVTHWTNLPKAPEVKKNKTPGLSKITV